MSGVEEAETGGVLVTKADYDAAFKILKDRGAWSYSQVRQLLHPPKGLHDEYVQAAISGMCANLNSSDVQIVKFIARARSIADAAMLARAK